ncbi:MAG: allantoate amidohydrolase [Pseudomonadales bacterium]
MSEESMPGDLPSREQRVASGGDNFGVSALTERFRMTALADEVMVRCETLAGISALPSGISRAFLTREHREANDLVASWMEAAGMCVREDGAGSVIGRFMAERADAPVLVIGSHLDSVPNAGRYDGTLGVLLGIAAVERLRVLGRNLPFHVDVVGFGDEEGVRFGATLLSSRAMAGGWSDDWLALVDEQGSSLEQALRDFGLDPRAVDAASRSRNALAGYLEVHIEQGPVLEQKGLPVGLVTAIAGTRRLLVTIRGQAGHAGTVPMSLRQDALVGAAKGVALLEATAVAYGVTATVGRLTCKPGGVNVIPGEVEFTIDIRASDDGLRDTALSAFLEQLNQICAERTLELETKVMHEAPATPCSDWLQDELGKAIADHGLEVLRLVSGAGHDAMAMAAACPVAMLFVRCKGGISHNPAESVDVADVTLALSVLVSAVERLANTHPDSDMRALVTSPAVAPITR